MTNQTTHKVRDADLSPHHPLSSTRQWISASADDPCDPPAAIGALAFRGDDAQGLEQPEEKPARDRQGFGQLPPGASYPQRQQGQRSPATVQTVPWPGSAETDDDARP